ncbi:unnamed protein product [Arabidopsis thaliana]|uniref:Uncharacterized protein n=1 Tax=Arabidopsis thaliana TaxID=3702 RepID=A0A654FQ07_ARATH|nr:unnamed protein product [Arabidopsis thaliana]
MSHHHFDKVTFASSTYDIIQALNKPSEWPNVLGHMSELLLLTNDKPNWFLMMEHAHCNRGASDIATSVITGFRFQSYVARGYPFWMTKLFTEERDELWDELQQLELGRQDPTLIIPHAAYATVEPRNRLSLIARPLNPRSQNLHAVISALPRAWGLTNRVHGRVINDSFVQFIFQSEIDLLSVHRREPWLYNNWFVTAQRWEVNLTFHLLTTIELWVQMRGIPLLYVCEETTLEIAQGLGEIISLDFHDATTTQIAYIRVRIRFGITDRLRFFQRIIFASGETALISFQYERLRKICSSCFRITHHRNSCPYRPTMPINRVTNNATRTGREDVFMRDENLRSSMNSQSQMSESSFPVPFEPPPRVPHPPINTEELEAAYFPHTRAASLPNHARSTDQVPYRRDVASRDSNIHPFTGPAFATNTPRLVEIGESSRQSENTVSEHLMEKGDSSKRKNMADPRNEETVRQHKHQEKDQMIGGILNPPKKR